MLDKIAEFLEREAGHLAVLLILMVIGIICVSQGWNKGDVILDGSFGALIYAMKGMIRGAKA